MHNDAIRGLRHATATIDGFRVPSAWRCCMTLRICICVVDSSISAANEASRTFYESPDKLLFQPLMRLVFYFVSLHRDLINSTSREVNYEDKFRCVFERLFQLLVKLVLLLVVKLASDISTSDEASSYLLVSRIFELLRSSNAVFKNSIS